jgi:hypothetical protein
MVLVVAFSDGYDDRYQAANGSLGEHEPEGEMAKKVALYQYYSIHLHNCTLRSQNTDRIISMVRALRIW